MPYGASIKGDLGGISPKDEAAVCLSGPLVSGATALAFVALWWLFPETYPYTDTAAYVCASLFFVNLLPAYPLDGGRLMFALLKRYKKRGRIAGMVVHFATICSLAGAFVYSCFSTPNFSLLFFCAFLIFGGMGGGNYRRIAFSREKSFLRGVEERRVAISATRSVGYALRFLREDKYTVFVLFEGETFLGEVGEEEFLSFMRDGDWEKPLSGLL